MQIMFVILPIQIYAMGWSYNFGYYNSFSIDSTSVNVSFEEIAVNSFRFFVNSNLIELVIFTTSFAAIFFFEKFFQRVNDNLNVNISTGVYFLYFKVPNLNYVSNILKSLLLFLLYLSILIYQIDKAYSVGKNEAVNIILYHKSVVYNESQKEKPKRYLNNVNVWIMKDGEMRIFEKDLIKYFIAEGRSFSYFLTFNKNNISNGLILKISNTDISSITLHQNR